MNNINYSDEEQKKLRHLIVGYLQDNSSRSNTISCKTLWEIFNIQLKSYFESVGITEHVFAMNCIFLIDKGLIKQLTLGNPTVKPENTFYYV